MYKFKDNTELVSDTLSQSEIDFFANLVLSWCNEDFLENPASKNIMIIPASQEQYAAFEGILEVFLWVYLGAVNEKLVVAYKIKVKGDNIVIHISEDIAKYIEPCD